MHVRQVVVGDQRRRAQVHLGAVVQRAVQLRRAPGAQRAHRALQQPRVHRIADLVDLPALALAEDLACAADLEVVGGQREADPEVLQRLDGLQALHGVGGHRGARRHDEVRVGAVVRAPDAAPELVQLGEPEAVGAVDDDGVRGRHVDARLDDGGAHQHVEAPVVEVQHHALEIALGPVDVLHLVVHEVHLSAAADLALDRLAHQRAVPFAHEGLDRQAPLGRRRDDGQVTHARQRHVQRARDRGRGQREHVGLRAQRLQSLLVAHAEAVLLVDDREPELLEAHVALHQAVGADHDVHAPRGEIGHHLVALLLRAEARELLDAHRLVGEAIAEVLVVLLREQGGRDQHRDLVARAHRDEGRAHRDLGLAEADVAAHQAVHRGVGAHVLEHRLDREALVRRLLEREVRLERGERRRVRLEADARTRRAPRVHVEQLCGDVEGLLRGAPARLQPLPAAQTVQRRGFGVGAGVTPHEVQRRDRHVQAVAVGVLDAQELALGAADLQRLEAAVAADAMVLVHHRRPAL